MKKIKVPLSVDSLKELTKKLDRFKTDVEEAKKQIVSDLIDIAENEIKSNYASSIYSTADEKIGRDDKSAFVEGSQVLYREFGTGTMGLQDSHPIKGNFNLNPYNSGRTIRRAGENINPETGILPR